MLEVYWGCLIGGAIFAILTVLLGDLVGHGGHDISHGEIDHDGLDFLKPAVIVSAIAAFGGAGILLSKYTSLLPAMAAGLAVSIALVTAVLVYFLYIKPMMKSENSVGYSMGDLVGKIGEVITSIPEKGYGEVMVRVGAANTSQIAASIDHVEIRSGTQVVVVEADRDTLYVVPANLLSTPVEHP